MWVVGWLSPGISCLDRFWEVGFVQFLEEIFRWISCNDLSTFSVEWSSGAPQHVVLYSPVHHNPLCCDVDGGDEIISSP